MITSPPRLVGTATVAPLYGVTRSHMTRKLAAGEARVGYLGKVGNKHTWNLHELLASLFATDAAIEMVVDALGHYHPSDPLDSMLCAVQGCDRLESVLGLCTRHLRHLMASWRHAGRSTLVTVQLVALCRWVVAHNRDVVLPEDFDPWSPVCMTEGCDNETNTHGGWHGPLCPACSAQFWDNAIGRARPRHWKGAA